MFMKRDRDHLEPQLPPTTPHTLPAIAHRFFPKLAHRHWWNWWAEGIIARSTTLEGYKTLFIHTTWIYQHDREHLGPPLPPYTPYIYILHAISHILPKIGQHLGVEWVCWGYNSQIHSTPRLQNTLCACNMDMTTWTGQSRTSCVAQHTIYPQ